MNKTDYLIKITRRSSGESWYLKPDYSRTKERARAKTYINKALAKRDAVRVKQVGMIVRTNKVYSSRAWL